MASTYLTKTFSGAGNRKKWTWSAWVKKHQESGSNTYNTPLFGTAGSSYDTISFLTTPNAPKFFINVGGGFERQTNALHRDCFGWYHLVVTFDSAQGTATDRLKVYINGVQQSSFSDNTNGSQNGDSYINSTDAHQIGKQQTLSRYGDFSMSHIHFCDGYAYAASDFGQTDSTTGEWSIKTSPSVSYGTNGFFILKDGNSLTDESPNSNNWSVGGGTLTKTEDNPSNNFATLNALNQVNGNATLSYGNTQIAVSGNWLGAISTLGVFKGKWYFEFQSDGNNFGVGICKIGGRMSRTIELSAANSGYLGKYNDSWSYYNNGGNSYKLTNDSTTSHGSDFGNGDFGMFCLDADNGKIWAGKNGTWFNSGGYAGNPASGTYAMFDSLDNSSGWHVGAFGENSTTKVNFGNGAFGSTQLTGTTYQDSAGRGVFKYQPPANFLALCTRNLNE
tara:strand:- start:261 stop:1601 length:1341 start_codon:yes stop_codon:yes gene_type:complete